MIKFVFSVILGVLAFRFLGSLFGRSSGGAGRRVSGGGDPGRSDLGRDDYHDLTPYDIEDADYEELPEHK